MTLLNKLRNLHTCIPVFNESFPKTRRCHLFLAVSPHEKNLSHHAGSISFHDSELCKKTFKFIGKKTVTDLIRRIAWSELRLYSASRATHQESHKDVSLEDFFCGANPKHQIWTKDTITVKEQQPKAELVKT